MQVRSHITSEMEMKTKLLIILIIIFFLVGVTSVVFCYKEEKGYAEDIDIIINKVGLDFDCLKFTGGNDIFYVYRRSCWGKYLVVYGFMDIENILWYENNLSYNTEICQGTDIIGFIHGDADVPEELLLRMDTTKKEVFPYLHAEEVGDIFIFHRSNEQYSFRLIISNSTGAFALRLISPPR